MTKEEIIHAIVLTSRIDTEHEEYINECNEIRATLLKMLDEIKKDEE